jgi:hypothetical protein
MPGLKQVVARSYNGMGTACLAYLPCHDPLVRTCIPVWYLFYCFTSIYFFDKIVPPVSLKPKQSLHEGSHTKQLVCNKCTRSQNKPKELPII